MSAAEMSSEGGTRSHPRAGLYVFVPRSQFSKGEGRCDGDHGVQRNERERVLEPRGSSSRTSRGRRSSIARRLIRSRTSSFVPESASTEAQLPSRRIRTETPRRAAAKAASRKGLGVSPHISSK